VRKEVIEEKENEKLNLAEKIRVRSVNTLAFKLKGCS
jgi:hypothetical protein